MAATGTATSLPCIAPALAVAACASMAFLYVALLYAPSLLLRLPPPASLRQHMLRRFACAIIATFIAVVLSSLLLPIKMYEKMDYASWLNVYGLRRDHWWQAVVFPLLLTALLYLGPLVMAALDQVSECQEEFPETSNPRECLKYASLKVVQNTKSLVSDILAWRNFIVAPLTEEIVFRACMIPTLLCAGFYRSVIIFLCPLFFGLAHLNHFWELVYQQNWGKKRASVIVGMQLGYTTIFGWYASFLYLRTGHLLAPLVAHIFCNIMGLPTIDGALQERGLMTIFIIGILGFFFMLGPASNPNLYNETPEACNCWLGYCKWR